MNDLLTVTALGHHVVLVQVEKDLDWATAPIFKEKVSQLLSGKKALLCSLRDGHMVDSSGLEAIGTLQIRAMGLGVPLGLVCSDLNQRRLFKLTGLDDFVAIYHTVSEGYANVLVSLAAA